MAPKRTSKPTPTPDVLKAVADLVEPIGETIHKGKYDPCSDCEESPANCKGMAECDSQLSVLARSNAFFARNGNLRVHGNFTINELYEAFKARLDYEAGE